MLSLYIACRSLGVRWPLTDEDELEVWQAPGSALVFVISGSVLRTLVQQHLNSLELHSGAPPTAASPSRTGPTRRPRAEIAPGRREPPLRSRPRRAQDR